jgi:hypothetical protein
MDDNGDTLREWFKSKMARVEDIKRSVQASCDLDDLAEAKAIIDGIDRATLNAAEAKHLDFVLKSITLMEFHPAHFPQGRKGRRR